MRLQTLAKGIAALLQALMAILNSLSYRSRSLECISMLQTDRQYTGIRSTHRCDMLPSSVNHGPARQAVA
jgi:hypothetical protein